MIHTRNPTRKGNTGYAGLAAQAGPGRILELREARTEITSLLIVTRLEQYDYAGATAIAVVMLTASFLMLMTINGLQWWYASRYGSAR